MKRLTLLIIVLLTATLSCSGKAEGCQCQDAADDFQKEKIASIAPKQNRNNNVAMLSNTRSTYRICNTRPQRLLPTYSSNPAKTQGKNHFYSIHKRFKFFKLPYDGRRRQETAPFSSSASCDYYVIALRRILC